MKKITCSYGTTALICVTLIDNKPVLVLDMNIKGYKYCENGWHDVVFSPNTVIQDKLFLDESLKDQLLHVLDVFLKTTYLPEDCDETARGFRTMMPKDMYGNTLSIQESSNVEPALWLGADTDNKIFVWNNDTLEPFVSSRRDFMVQDRLHLKTPQAKRLRKIIVEQWTALTVKSD